MKIKKIAFYVDYYWSVVMIPFWKGILIPICRIKHTLLPKKIWNFILILSIMS